MWQTEINIFLQSFSSEYLTAFFKLITGIGGESAAIVLSVVIMFGMSFRKGMILLHVCAFGRCISDILKTFFALPRPVAVDSNVKMLWKNKPNTTPFTSMGAKKFFSMLPRETIDMFRAQNPGSYGFPSGTSTRAISFWGMLYMLYKSKWVRIAAALFIVIIPFSRIYFGRHFLADVLGSFVVSFAIISVVYLFVYRNENLMRFLFDENGLNMDKRFTILILYLFLLPMVLALVPRLTTRVMGPLLGINAAYFILRIQGLPKDEGDLKNRLARIGIAGICFVLFFAGPQWVLRNSIILEIQPILISLKALGSFLFLWVAVKINIRLGFFKY